MSRFNRLLKKSRVWNGFLSSRFWTGRLGSGAQGKGIAAFSFSASSRREELRQSCEVVGGHGEDEAGSHPFKAALDGLGHASDGLGPAESLFNPFAVLKGHA